MNSLLKEITEDKKFSSYINDIKIKNSPITLSGLSDVGKVGLICATKEKEKRPICIITSNELQAQKLQKDILYFANNEKVKLFPRREIVTYDYIAESKELLYERIEVLNDIKEKKIDYIITTIEAVMQNMISNDVLYRNIINFKVGKNYDIEKLKQEIIDLGYERCEIIEGKGQFSVRGGIIDISLNSNVGVRIEFWGDEIDSIRTFDIISQRSKDMIDNINIYPAHEFLLEDSTQKICERIVRNIYSSDIVEEKVEEDIEQIKVGNYLSKIDKYFNEFYLKQSNFLDYLPNDSIIFIDEENKIKVRCKNILNDNNIVIENLIEKEKIIPESLKDLKNYDEVIEKIKTKQTVFLEMQDISNKIINLYHFEYRDVIYFDTELEIMFEHIQKELKNNKKIVILGGSEESSRKISMLLLEKEIKHKYVEKLDKKIEEGLVTVSKGILSSGFENFNIGLLVISGNELFEENHRRKTNMSKAFKQGEKIVFADLKVGDIVVHQTNGIGEFIRCKHNYCG